MDYRTSDLYDGELKEFFRFGSIGSVGVGIFFSCNLLYSSVIVLLMGRLSEHRLLEHCILFVCTSCAC